MNSVRLACIRKVGKILAQSKKDMQKETRAISVNEAMRLLSHKQYRNATKPTVDVETVSCMGELQSLLGAASRHGIVIRDYLTVTLPGYTLILWVEIPQAVVNESGNDDEGGITDGE